MIRTENLFQFLGDRLGCEKPGFYFIFGYVAKVLKRNPVSGLVRSAGVRETGFLFYFRLCGKGLGKKPGFWVTLGVSSTYEDAKHPSDFSYFFLGFVDGVSNLLSTWPHLLLQYHPYIKNNPIYENLSRVLGKINRGRSLTKREPGFCGE